MIDTTVQDVSASKLPVIGKAHTGFRVTTEPGTHRIMATFNGEIVADSARVLIMHETRLANVYYFPREDVRMDFLERTSHCTNCPFKGNASHWSITVGGKTVENAAWSYEEAFDEAASVTGYIAFYWNAMDRWFADDIELTEQPRDMEPVEDNPFVGWLISDASRATSSEDLFARFARLLVSEGVPVGRLRLLIRTLNPQLFAIGYTWQRNSDEIEVFEATHGIRRSERYLNSPFAPIVEGEGGVRRRLEGPDPRLDYPILHELLEEGATDYVALPLKFSDGQINILALTSDAPGGFSTRQLGHLYEILPNLARQLEAHAHRKSAVSLLRTYLGRNAGRRVWEGRVERGDREEMHAVIWVADLRESTALAQALPRDEYLALLNDYFDAVAGSVIEHGGEVLKFIGDAVLGIFPISDPDHPKPEACMSALAAAKSARDAIAALNADRAANGCEPLQFGIGLHRGDLAYGNVGTEQRLDFTVIGAAVNEATRIENLTKTVGQPVLVSQLFAQSVSCPLVSVGTHTLRGVDGEREIFSVPGEADVTA